MLCMFNCAPLWKIKVELFVLIDWHQAILFNAEKQNSVFSKFRIMSFNLQSFLPLQFAVFSTTRVSTKGNWDLIEKST